MRSILFAGIVLLLMCLAGCGRSDGGNSPATLCENPVPVSGGSEGARYIVQFHEGIDAQTETSRLGYNCN
jgi:hypothetical protein